MVGWVGGQEMRQREWKYHHQRVYSLGCPGRGIDIPEVAEPEPPMFGPRIGSRRCCSFAGILGWSSCRSCVHGVFILISSECHVGVVSKKLGVDDFCRQNLKLEAANKLLGRGSWTQ